MSHILLLFLTLLSTWTRNQNSYILVSDGPGVYNKNLFSQCNLTVQIELVQDNVYYIDFTLWLVLLQSAGWAPVLWPRPVKLCSDQSIFQVFLWTIYKNKFKNLNRTSNFKYSFRELLIAKWVWFRFMVFNATFNNISVVSWQTVLLVEETGVPGENHRQTLSNNAVSSTPRLIGNRTHNVSSDRNWLHR